MASQTTGGVRLKAYPGLRGAVSLPCSCPAPPAFIALLPKPIAPASLPSLTPGLSTYQTLGVVKSLELESYLFSNIY